MPRYTENFIFTVLPELLTQPVPVPVPAPVLFSMSDDLLEGWGQNNGWALLIVASIIA